MMLAIQGMAVHLSDRHFRTIAELIEGQVGIKLPQGKRLMLEGRLHKRVRALNFSDLNEYVDNLFEPTHFDAELTHLIDVVTTNKTDFFREPQHFTFMREIAIPALLKSHGRKNANLKVWSSAISTGMEAYTVAMVLDDMTRSGSRFQYRILGTDISTAVLRLARTAIYTRDVLAPVPEPFVKRYFLSSRDRSRVEVRVVPELRRMTHFMRMNLMDPSYPVDRYVDMIFCRNVLIYFDKPTQEAVINRICKHLRPGGYLYISHSESLTGLNVPLEVVGNSIYRKVAKHS